MKHATLYRKWRPRRMGEVVGQEPVVRTLARAIETDRVAHAYLFSGPRGTGKTSTAKVLAMGLNCVQGPTPEPDGTCGSCRAIINGSSLDVVEMDAASNRGIDEIRDLRDRVNLAPVAGRMKVYIIDEVHMLTSEAFNALLKMLEEPPEHVVFVLATTEKHKVLPTIISRCQAFDFRRPGVETLVGKLTEIAEAEGIGVEPEALTAIAREARGSFRDAEGLLDQLSSFAEGPITAAMVRELLGSVGPEMLLESTAALQERRAADALRVVDRLTNEGRDLGQFLGELISHLRNVMLLPYAPEVALAEVGAEERGALEGQARSIPTAEVVRLIEALGDTLGRVKRGGDPKLELELSFLKLTRDYSEPSVDNLLRRLEALEMAVERGDLTTQFASEAVSREAARDALSDSGPERAEEPEDNSRDEGNGSPEVSHAEESPGEQGFDFDWDLVMQELRERHQVPVAALYQVATVEDYSEGVLKLAFPKDMEHLITSARESKRSEPLREILERYLGVKPRLELRVADGTSVASVTVPSTEESHRSVPSDVGKQRVEPTPKPVVEDEAPEEAESANSSGGGTAEGRELPAEATGRDDTIGSENEAFEMAREWFGPRDPNGGS